MGRHGDFLKQESQLKIEIIGHCLKSGKTNGWNQVLGIHYCPKDCYKRDTGHIVFN
jgi:hypothetical protein